MKKINKVTSPIWFEKWKKDFKEQNSVVATYKKDFPSEKRRELRKELLEEQGYICCYCMSRISINNSHIEHFWPQVHFNNLDMDYKNMLASCQGECTTDDHCGHNKNDWYSLDMVCPTEKRIESMFYYTADGQIHYKDTGKEAHIEKEMIEHLGLDSYNLERNRKTAIQNSEYFDDTEYSEAEIDEFIEYYEEKHHGKYIPYCNAIIDCLRNY